MKIGAKVIKKTNINKLNYKIMKRFQIYLNGRAIKDTDSLRRAEIMFEKICNKSNYTRDNVELYDSLICVVCREF